MTDAKQAWKEWLDEIEQEAADLEGIAFGLTGEINPFRADAASIRVATDGGKKVHVGVRDEVENLRAEIETRLRVDVVRLRADAAIAKWLGDPKRAATLEVVAMTGDEHRKAYRCLPTTTRDAVSGRRLHRWNDGNDLRIERIVAGARLYAATRKP
jgi:hypothetical protein